MRRLILLLAAPFLLSLTTGCNRGLAAADSFTPIPTGTPATSQPTIAPPTPGKTPSTQESADGAVREVAALLQKQAPALLAPDRPGSGPFSSIGARPNPRPAGDAPLLPTPTPAPAAADEVGQESAIAPVGVVNASVVNVRTGPGTVYSVADRFQKSSDFAISGRNDDGTWLQVCCATGDDVQNWIAAGFVDVRLPQGTTLRDVPVAEAPPTPEPSAASAAPAVFVASASAVGLPGPGAFSAPGSANPLTGQALPGERSGQRPVIVCINNDYAARPQLGTSQADVVYEYLMEGYGITRYSAIYYGEPSGQIGPVRSARLINYYMGALYDAGLACSGASDQVRYALKHQAPFPYMDIDLDDPSNSRYSVSIGTDYRTRLRTSTDQLRRWLADWGVEKPAAIRGFTFGGVPAGGAPATIIGIPYPSGKVGYRYDPGSGRDLLALGGGAHVDGNTGAPLGLENVIVQYVPHQATDIVEDSLGSTSIRLDLFGSGRAIVFRDGLAFEGTWRSESRGDTPRFYDAAGAEIPLKPGHTWISIVPSTYDVTYQ